MPKLQLEKVLLSDVADMIAARERSKIIHATADIDTAGDEVEEAVRQVLRRKLPLAYYTGHGHIVDHTWRTSPQLDIVLADNFSMPVLFKTQDGTEYFPYESVFGVGEVKSTYYKNKNYIESFVERCRALRALYRKKTGDPETDCINPLLTFMLFVDSGEFSINDIEQLYITTPASELPNLVCFLDKGLLFYGEFALNDLGQKILVHYITAPELIKPKSGRYYHWVFIPFGDQSNRHGANWGNLYHMILGHLRDCRLAVPNMATYFLGVKEWNDGTIITAEE